MLLEVIHELSLERGGGEESFGACKIKVFFLGP